MALRLLRTSKWSKPLKTAIRKSTNTTKSVVFTFENMYVPYERTRDDLDIYQSTLVGIYSSVNLARAALRKEMKDAFDSESVELLDFHEDFKKKNSKRRFVDWDQFYCGPADIKRDAAIEALIRGDDGAEAKFDFPWKEDWKDGRVDINIGLLQRIRLKNEEENSARRPYNWECIEGGYGHCFVIRCVNVSEVAGEERLNPAWLGFWDYK